MKLKKNNLKISCLGSVYSGSKLKEVKLSINSLLDSIEAPDEIVLVKDGKIRKNLYKYLLECDKKKVIKLVESKKNIGLGLALNLGLNECKYDTICRFDTDDISLSNRISESKKAFIEDPNLDIFGSNIIEFIDAKSKFVKCNLKDVPKLNEGIHSTLDFRNPMNHPSIVFKKSSISKLGAYENIIFFEDYHLWLKARKKNCKFMNTSKPLILMKRKSHSDRRQGYDYARKEFKFFIVSMRQRLLNFKSYIFFPLRILSRFIPFRASFLYYLFPWRNNYTSCLNPLYQKEYSLESLNIRI
tara:strand:+ start:1417 stop:2316 length:900 start_codon:yes stop_codon:yes gene_type:complete